MKRKPFIMVMMIFFTVSCSNMRWHEKVVFENQNSKVSLESKEENRQILNNIYTHPAALDENSLEMFLKSIFFLEETGFFSGRKKASVFLDDEIKNLVSPIIDCLKIADSSQRIHFISYNRGDGGVFSHLRKTEGVVFIRPSGILNIAFSLVNDEITPHVNDDPVEMEVNTDPLKLKNSQASVFSGFKEVKNHEFENGKKSPVWLVVNINALENEFKMHEKTEEKIKKESSITPTKSGEKDDSWDGKKDELTVRLKYIKELFSQGLISKEEYEEKKKELLKQIQ